MSDDVAQDYTRLRRFKLVRRVDETGMSGVGVVAVGVEFPSGRCIMEWLPRPHSLNIYNSIVEVIHIHGHGDRKTTEVVWEDE